MGGPGGHVEGGGDNDQLRTRQHHQLRELRKPEIKADAHPHHAPRRLKGGDAVSRRQGLGLHEPLAARHVNVKEVHLSMLGRQLSVRRKHIAGVVHSVLRQLRQGAAHQPDAPLTGQCAEGPIRRAALGLAIGTEAGVVIGAAEHLRQHCHVDVSRLPHHVPQRRAAVIAVDDPQAIGVRPGPPQCRVDGHLCLIAVFPVEVDLHNAACRHTPPSRCLFSYDNVKGLSLQGEGGIIIYQMVRAPAREVFRGCGREVLLATVPKVPKRTA